MEKDISTEISRLAKMSTADLVAALKQRIGMTVETFIEMAEIIKILDSRNVDYDDLEIPQSTITYLRRIASNTLAAVAYHAFHHKPTLLCYVGRLPLNQQAIVATDEPMRVAVSRPGGSFDVCDIKPSDMTPRTIKQVFGMGTVRSESEQCAQLRQKAKETIETPRNGPVTWRVIQSRNGIEVKRPTFITLAELKTIIAELN